MIYVLLGVVLLGFAAVSLMLRNPVLLALHLIPGLGLLAFAVATRRGELRERLWGPAGRRGAWFGSNVALQTLALIVILAGAAYAARRSQLSWDWTEAGLFTLTSGSQQVLAQIPEDETLHLVGFFTAPGVAREFLDMYAFASDRIVYRIVDPNREPLLARQLEVEKDQTLVVCEGECTTAERRRTLVSPNEARLTRAIRGLIAEPRKLYFVSGHDEAKLDSTEGTGLSALASLLEQENVEAAPLLLAQAQRIPEDADALVIAAPSFSFFERELVLLEEYLRAGGRVVMLLDPLQRVKLEAFVERFGIRLGDDIIVDQPLQMMGSGAMGVELVVSEYADHPVTRVLQGQPTVFNLSRSIEPVAGVPDASTTVLFRSSPQSRAVPQSALGPQGLVLDDARDRPGPHSLAIARVVANAQQGGAQGRLVVFGDSDFVRNRSVVEGSNADLFLNLVNWLADDESFIAIERKRPRASRVEFTPAEYRTLSYFVILFVPESILLLGVLNWWRRRRV